MCVRESEYNRLHVLILTFIWGTSEKAFSNWVSSTPPEPEFVAAGALAFRLVTIEELGGAEPWVLAEERLVFEEHEETDSVWKWYKIGKTKVEITDML